MEAGKTETPDDELPGSLRAALGVARQEFPHTVDAKVWAEKWAEALERNPAMAADRGTVLAWFANSIMAGFDTANLRTAQRLREEAERGEEAAAGRNEADFRQVLAALLNRYSKENGSNTPDHVLAEYLLGCLDNFDRAVQARARWYGFMQSPGMFAEPAGGSGPGVARESAELARALATEGGHGGLARSLLREGE